MTAGGSNGRIGGRIRGLACDCGSRTIIAVCPGAEQIAEPAIISIRTRRPRVVQRPVRPRAFCLACWQRRFAAAEAA